jgi:hypothetical protein
MRSIRESSQGSKAYLETAHVHIKKTSMRHSVFVDLGYGVLDTAMVKTGAYCPEAADKKETS